MLSGSLSYGLCFCSPTWIVRIILTILVIFGRIKFSREQYWERICRRNERGSPNDFERLLRCSFSLLHRQVRSCLVVKRALCSTGYVIGEIPSNMLLTRLRPSLYLPGLMFVWGAVAIALAAAHSTGSLAGIRVVLGFAESGFSPGVLFFLSSCKSVPRNRTESRVQEERARETLLYLLDRLSGSWSFRGPTSRSYHCPAGWCGWPCGLEMAVHREFTKTVDTGVHISRSKAWPHVLPLLLLSSSSQTTHTRRDGCRIKRSSLRQLVCLRIT